ncbi:MAG: hypothetical protein RL653_2750 [Pseudomonadota bacterium]|jgi:hypothetical protein
MTLRSLAPAALLLGLLSACPARPTCDASACDGCCDAQGTCQAGTTSSLCGSGGATCNACGANESCQSNACAPVSQVGGEDAGTDAGTRAEACTTTAVTCPDETLLDLGLKSTVNSDGVTNTPDGAGWISVVNASGGGFSPTKSYVYAAFTAEGLSQLPFSDEQALSNAQWDIGFRRFVLRLNGGDSGPSCVSAAIAGGASFESVTAASATGVSEVDGFFDDSCTFVDDGSGLTTSPKTALSSFYAYTQCVRMTGAVFIVSLADGRKVKAQVLGYYQQDSAQAACQAGSPQQGAAGGYIKLRWAFL